MMPGSETYASPRPPVLQIDGLRVDVKSRRGRSMAVIDDVSFSVAEGEVLALVGESGCGKSVTARSILRVLPEGMSIASGSIRLNGRELTGLSEADLNRVRGQDAAMVFQEPMNSLNPVMSIGDQVIECLSVHGTSGRQARERAIHLLERVGIPSPSSRMADYPHRLSGGMRQRAMIAMALACRPRLIIADEPTTALDATIQRQILDLLHEIQAETGMALLLITHDLSVVRDLAQHVAVMYAGRIVERGPCADVMNSPAHPYSKGLIAALPAFDRYNVPPKGRRFFEIAGQVPSIENRPTGCRFQPRCDRSSADCHRRDPDLGQVRGRDVACILPCEGPP